MGSHYMGTYCVSATSTDGTGIQRVLAPLLQGFRPTLKMHIERVMKLGVCKQHYGREAFFHPETAFAAQFFVPQNIKQRQS